MRNTRLPFAIVMCILAAFGQVSTGSIRGTVTDPSGAVVPDAVIVLTNVRTGVVQSVKSDSSGNYLIDFVPTGDYKINVEMVGFKKFERDNITLDMSRQLRVDVPIQPGLVTETISVSATTSLVETETGVLSTTVENRQVTSLPLLGRDLPPREGMKLEFRAEFYNLFNTPQFSDPNMTVNAGTAGRITGSKSERQGQMALKLYF